MLQYFLNHADLNAELDQLFATRTIHRLGTGEFTDSLIWEPWTGLSEGLIRKFAGQDGCVLELKTKTTFIDTLLDLPHRRRTILGMVLNTERVIGSEERGTAPLDARLKAAARCAAQGYPLAFHFDPIVIDDGCEAEYRLERRTPVCRHRPPAYCLDQPEASRFMPVDLKGVVQDRFPLSKIPYGEFITGLDGKMRYFRPLRMQIYRAIAQAIRAQAPDVCLYFCMEDDEVWQDALHFVPAERGSLARTRLMMPPCGSADAMRRLMPALH